MTTLCKFVRPVFKLLRVVRISRKIVDYFCVSFRGESIHVKLLFKFKNKYKSNQLHCRNVNILIRQMNQPVNMLKVCIINPNTCHRECKKMNMSSGGVNWSINNKYPILNFVNSHTKNKHGKIRH